MYGSYVGPAEKLIPAIRFRKSSNGKCNLIQPFRENSQAKPATEEARAGRARNGQNQKQFSKY